MGDLIFLDWVDDEEEDVAVQQESNSRIVNGWGSNAEANPFVPASVSASPWLNTKYRPARVASKKTNRLQTREIETQENEIERIKDNTEESQHSRKEVFFED